MAHCGKNSAYSRFTFGLVCAVSAFLGLLVGGWQAYPTIGSASTDYVQRISLLDRATRLVTAPSGTAPSEGEGAELAAEVLPDAEAFADSPDSPIEPASASRPAEATSKPSPGRQGVQPVDFDLGSQPAGTGVLRVEKTIRLNGEARGVARLSIDHLSRLHLSASDLSNLLPAELFARVDNGSDYIAVDEMRADGLKVSYDPLADTVEIES